MVLQSWSTFPSYTQNPTVTQRYSFDGSTLLFDLDSSNNVQSRYVVNADGSELLARLDTSSGQKLWWYISDKDGGVIAILDTSGRAVKRNKGGGFKDDDTNTASTTQTGWVPNSDGSWTWVSWTPSTTLTDRFGYGGQEQDPTTGLLYTGGSWYDQDLARFISEKPDGMLGTNLYRYPMNSPQNVKIVPRANRDALDKATDFFAGVSDTLTAGLTARARKALNIDGVDYTSGEYGAGGKVGQAMNIGLMFANPASMGGLAASGASALNTAATVGNVLNGIDAFSEGRIWEGFMDFAGAGLTAVRGKSPCGWRSQLASAGQKGLHAIALEQGLRSAWMKLQDGDVIGSLLDLAESGANAYRFMQSCFAAGTCLRTPKGLRKVENLKAGDWLLARPENDPYGPVEPKVIEEVFIRTAPVRNLHVRGKGIRTTAEHPYWRKGEGWVPCAVLKPGDVIRGEEEDEWLTVESVTDSGEVTTVYNFRVADHHTYFVSGEGWGFSIWVHNAYFGKAHTALNKLVSAFKKGLGKVYQALGFWKGNRQTGIFAEKVADRVIAAGGKVRSVKSRVKVRQTDIDRELAINGGTYLLEVKYKLPASGKAFDRLVSQARGGLRRVNAGKADEMAVWSMVKPSRKALTALEGALGTAKFQQVKWINGVHDLFSYLNSK
jgi:RHS repeat-associated protein